MLNGIKNFIYKKGKILLILIFSILTILLLILYFVFNENKISNIIGNIATGIISGFIIYVLTNIKNKIIYNYEKNNIIIENLLKDCIEIEKEYIIIENTKNYIYIIQLFIIYKKIEDILKRVKDIDNDRLIDKEINYSEIKLEKQIQKMYKNQENKITNNEYFSYYDNELNKLLVTIVNIETKLKDKIKENKINIDIENKSVI